MFVSTAARAVECRRANVVCVFVSTVVRAAEVEELTLFGFVCRHGGMGGGVSENWRLFVCFSAWRRSVGELTFVCLCVFVSTAARAAAGCRRAPR